MHFLSKRKKHRERKHIYLFHLMEVLRYFLFFLDDDDFMQILCVIRIQMYKLLYLLFAICKYLIKLKLEKWSAHLFHSFNDFNVFLKLLLARKNESKWRMQIKYCMCNGGNISMLFVSMYVRIYDTLIARSL